MESHEYGFKIISRYNGKFYIYPNCKENLLKAIEDDYQLEYDTKEISGHQRIWVPYSGEINEHYTRYRMIPKD